MNVPCVAIAAGAQPPIAGVGVCAALRTAPCAMSALLDARHRHIAKVVAQQFGLSVAAVEEVLAEERALATAADFFAAEGNPSKLIFFRQSRDVFSEDGELIESAGARVHVSLPSAPPSRHAPIRARRARGAGALPDDG